MGVLCLLFSKAVSHLTARLLTSDKHITPVVRIIVGARTYKFYCKIGPSQVYFIIIQINLIVA